MQDGQPRTAEIKIRNVLEDMPLVVEFVEAFGRSRGIPPKVINDLNVCLDELLNNTISYGYDNRGDHSIQVRLVVDGNQLLADVEDDGRPFDPLQSAEPNLAGDLQSRRLGGVGIHFVKSLMDSVDYVRSGRYNRTTLRKRLRT
jgi:anti-sigma regulatory factor (Ser/Thr protein kinase)